MLCTVHGTIMEIAHFKRHERVISLGKSVLGGNVITLGIIMFKCEPTVEKDRQPK